MTTTTPTLMITDYRLQLLTRLEDLDARAHGEGVVLVEGLRIYLDADNSQRLVTGVTVQATRHRGRQHRYTNVALPHIEAAIRRLLVERAARLQQNAAQLRAAEAGWAREKAAAARVHAAVEAINARSIEARWGKLVIDHEVTERTDASGTHTYLWELELQGLDEAAVLDILRIVDARRPWEPTPTVAELFTPDPETDTDTK